MAVPAIDRQRKRGNRRDGTGQSREVTVGPARRVRYQQLGLPLENSIHVCVHGWRLYSPRACRLSHPAVSVMKTA